MGQFRRLGRKVNQCEFNVARQRFKQKHTVKMLNINYIMKEQVQLGLLLQRVQEKARFTIKTIKAIKKKSKFTHPADGPFRLIIKLC